MAKWGATAKAEAKWAREPEVKLPEINPKGHSAKGLEMAARRAIALKEICQLYLEYLLESTTNEALALTLARQHPPIGTGSTEIDKRVREIAGGNLAVSEPIFTHRWEWAFDLWYEGRIDSQIEEVLRILPEENRQRVWKREKG